MLNIRVDVMITRRFRRYYDRVVYSSVRLLQTDQRLVLFCPQKSIEGVVPVGVQEGAQGTRERTAELRRELQEDGVAEQRRQRRRCRGRRTAAR